MRVSSNASLNSFLFNQQQLLSSSLAHQVQLSTGRVVQVPSDQPLQASQILKLNEADESQQQVLENIRHATDFMNATDAALADISDSLIRVQELASAAVGSLVLEGEREAAAIEIDSILQHLTFVANETHLGSYLFAGTGVRTQPVQQALGGIQFLGNRDDMTTRVAADHTQGKFNITADDAFGMLSERVVGSVDLDPAVTVTTRLDELLGATGEGLRLSSLRMVEDGAAGTYTVDLTGANSVGQIIDRINRGATEAGSTLAASLNTAGTGIRIDPGDPLTISSLDNAVIAGDLGLLTDTATSDPIEGGDLNRLLRPSTPIEDLLGGAGLDLTNAGFFVRNGTADVAIDFSSARTVQDILNAINQPAAGVRAEIAPAGNAVAVINELSGTLMTVEGSAATALGVRTLGGAATLDDLNGGRGVRRADNAADLEIVAKDGGRFTVDLDGALEMNDVIERINQAAADAGVGIEASLPDDRNGLRLVDSSGGAGALQVRAANFSEAVVDLGLDEPIDPAATEVVGRDVSGVRVNGIFSALIDLRDSLQFGNEQDITRASQHLDDALTRTARVQGLLGAEIRAIESRGQQTQRAVDATRVLLSQIQDVDFAEAITRFQQTQTALQASLLASGQSLNLSLLDYLS